jgi:hypothetical protein
MHLGPGAVDVVAGRRNRAKQSAGQNKVPQCFAEAIAEERLAIVVA